MKKICFILLLTLFIPAQLLVGEELDNYMVKSEAERAANRDVNKACWFGAGMTIIGSGVALMWHSSSPDPVAFAGKSPEYIRAYSDAYNSRVKKIQTVYSCLGCATTMTIAGFTLLMIELNNSCTDDEDCILSEEGCNNWQEENCCTIGTSSEDGSSCGSSDNSSCGGSSDGGSSCGSGSGG